MSHPAAASRASVTSLLPTIPDTRQNGVSQKESAIPEPVLDINDNIPLSIAIDPVALVTSECITVTSAMRKHARWAQSSVSAILGGGHSRPSNADLRQSLSRTGTPTIGRRPTIQDPLKANAPGDENQSLASRWGLRTKKGTAIRDDPLLSAFARLRRDLAGHKDMSNFDAPSLIHPFLQVIRSSSTSAAITSLAVISVTKFLSYNLITQRSPRINLAIHWLAAAITNCRFEASDSSADEVVLLRVLKLMELLMSRPEGRLLSDERVCDLMSTGLSMCCQGKLSEVLRRSAEMAMVTTCQVIFTRLKGLEIETLPTPRSRAATLSRTKSADLPKVDPQVNGDLLAQDPEPVVEPSQTSNGVKDHANHDLAKIDTTAPAVGGFTTDAIDEEDIKPYSLTSIKELFRVLIDLLDPHNREHSDTMRIMALRIIDVAMEVAGSAIAEHSTLAQLVEDDLCRHLFQLVRSDNMVLLNASLRVAGLLLSTCRKVLKLQQELYLSYLVACLHPRVDIPREPGIDASLYEGVPQAPKLVKPAPSQPSSGRSTPVPVKDRQKLGLEGGTRRPEAREAMIEAIGTMVRIPSFMTELFVNYDCEVDRQDLCEDMVGLLSRNAFPDSATWSTTNVPPLCLDSLLSFIQDLAERLDTTSEKLDSSVIQRLQAQRIRKKIIKSGAAKFNDDPKLGIAYLVKQGIIDNPDEPLQVAQFLKSTTRISKKMLGEYISKRSNVSLLTAFIGLFDFSSKRIDEALREMLGTFRLPGESPLIERIVTIFTEHYCSSAVPEAIANKDAAFILAYAIIMLNTDLYNPNVKAQKRMTPEDFARNLRGVNDSKDFPSEYLQDIYDAIKESEIILPDEHDNKNAFEYAWKELLMKSHTVGDLIPCDTNTFDAEMFRATWKPIVATLCYVFMSATDDAVYSRVVVGFDQCAQIAAKYGIVDAFDRIVHSLSSISTLASEVAPNTSLNTEVQVEQKSIMVSEMAVKFGRDFRGQLATAVLFRILAGHESVISETWPDLVRIICNLFVNSLIPFPIFQSNKLAALSPIPLQQPSQVIDRDGRLADTGLFSSLTSYLSSYAADEPPEPSEEELDNTLSTIDCVNACGIGTVLSNLYTLPTPQLASLVAAILAQLPEDTSPIVVVKPERPSTASNRATGPRAGNLGLSYNPSIVFLYELATVLALRDEDILASVGEKLASSLQTTVRDASNIHPVAASRVVHYLLELLRTGSVSNTRPSCLQNTDMTKEHDFIRTPVVLHTFSSFEDNVLDNTAPVIISGLGRCLSADGDLRTEILNSPDFWSILRRLHQHKTEPDRVFEMLQAIATSPAEMITADNYEATVELANNFATAGRIGTIQEQRRDFAARRGKQIKPPAKPDESTAVVERAVKAINIIYLLTSRIPSLISQSHLERSEAWAAYWSPIFRALSTQSLNPCREVRHRALAALQRALLSEGLTSTEHTEWIAIFGEVLFPLLLHLLKPEVYQLDQAGMGDTRLQAATLLCKIFLRHLDHLVACDRLLDTWLKVLELLDRMMNSGSPADQEGAMAEAVPENLKNILLVMAGSGYLIPPSSPSTASRPSTSSSSTAPTLAVKQRNKGDGPHDPDDNTARDQTQAQAQDPSKQQEQPQQQRLWRETEKRVKRFLPGLMEETFPAPPPPPPPQQQSKPQIPSQLQPQQSSQAPSAMPPPQHQQEVSHPTQEAEHGNDDKEQVALPTRQRHSQEDDDDDDGSSVD